ncbi:MAG: ABC transporter substrate-binding protein [Spirochaetaceae bacterium]|nr:ABC transporter substrate-binding protein [Spirochaetaceae bacterium]
MKWRGVLIAESLEGDHGIWDRVEVRGRSKGRLEREGSRGALHPSGYRFAGPCMVLLGLLALAAVPAQAEMPADALVMAKDISDIITLDPAEAFELTTGELLANVYDRIMTFEPEDPTVLTGGVAESHAVSDDGRTVTFRIRDGLTFHSGNPVRPEDVEFSLERAVLLDRSPSFIVTQFGWNADNVGELIEVVDDRRVRITIAEGFSPGLVLNALSAGVASVVDRELVLAHERDGDLGSGWLQTNSAGSGPFRVSSWKAGDAVVLEANPGHRRGPPGVQRVVLRHVSEPRAQRRLLEAGEVDVARDLTPELVAALAGNVEVAVDDHPKGVIVYLAANASHPILGDDRVVHALRHAVDYHGMVESFLAGQFIVHQAFWPRGLWAAYTETPYRLDLPRASSLLAQAGHGGGLAVRLDTLDSPPYPAIAEAVRQTLARIGVQAQVVTQEGAELWPRYRAREHELILAPWSPDYVDPHANADAFARNPDNRPEAGLTGVLAWRNAWARDDVNAAVVEARDELDPERRKLLYFDLQRRLQAEGPYVVMFQQTDQIARRTHVTGFVSGPNFDHVWYRLATKEPSVSGA